MLKVKITPNTDPVIRQTPGNLGIWDGVQFVFDDGDKGPFHAWVVCDGLPTTMQAACPPENTIFVPCEPPAIRGSTTSS